jgi:homoaconitase/3-isopropylmalate dehydratase large subunit
MGKTLFEKVWDSHVVGTLANGQTQLLIDTHLVHEVTSPQAFGMLRDLNLKVAYPHRTFATVDHIVPTDSQVSPFSDPLAEAMIQELNKNAKEFGITYFSLASGKQGIVHVVGPEQGITQPGTTIACGDSHTATHGAFGAIALGIGTTQVRDILATQTMALGKMKVRRINVDGQLRPGVYAKDVILHIIRLLGANGGIGYAYEYGGSLFDAMSMEERMTVCNMSIEGGARCGYVNPDEKTFEYLKGRPYSPQGDQWLDTVEKWRAVASDADSVYDDIVNIKAEDVPPTVTWGTSPDQAIAVTENVPTARKRHHRAWTHLHPGRARLHEAACRSADQGHQDRRGFHRLLHQRPPQRLPRSGEVHQGPQSRRWCQSHRRSRFADRRCAGQAGRSRQSLQRSRFRMARRRLLHVPRDESRQAHRRPALRFVLEPQLQRPSGQPHRPHRPHESHHGRRRRPHRQHRRRPRGVHDRGVTKAHVCLWQSSAASIVRLSGCQY